MIARRLASLKLTLLAMAILGVGVTAYGSQAQPASAWIVGPLALLALNLSAAIATNPAFRRNTPLLVFHLALLALVVLAGVGRLTYYKAQLELAQGEVFSGEVVASQEGPLHGRGLQAVRFVNDGFTIRYAPGVKRAETRNAVRVFDASGAVTEQVIGDNVPLLVGGYRFYTSFNKGFSLVFRWVPGGGEPQRGTVNLPAYPLHEYRQALEWQVPGGGPAIWTLLHFDRSPLDQASESWFRTPGSHHVVLRLGEARWELVPGQQVRLDGGTLVYEGLTTWMGYNVFYDWTIPWVLAASLLAVGALGWHFARQFRARAWDAA